jgi:predicted hotdog family 3-hydroxylacyl-ACP dehydratase
LSIGIVEDILSIIPQRQPFVMIDFLLYDNARLTRTAFRPAADNIFVDKDVFTEPGLIENMAQTAAAGAGYKSLAEGKPVQGGYIGAIKNLEIYALPKVNEELVTEINIENQVFNVMLVSGKIWCDNILIAQCEMKIFITGNEQT